MMPPMRRLALLLLVGVGSGAEAARTPFGWLYGTETLPERGAEIQTWLQELEGRAPGIDQTLVLWTPVFGITDQLELALPIELVYNRAAGAASTGLDKFGAELRWRLVAPDPVEAGPFAPLLRLAVKRLVGRRDAIRVDGGLVLGLDLGPVHLGADLGFFETVDTDGNGLTEARPGGGISVAITDELRGGVEAFADIVVDNPVPSWFGVGPSLAYSHGRSWLAGAFLIGVSHIDLAPRVLWGIAF
jgi:hypothetical protein